MPSPSSGYWTPPRRRPNSAPCCAARSPTDCTTLPASSADAPRSRAPPSSPSAPNAAWDGVVAGARALLVIRQIAALFGLRPGLAVTLTLIRRAATTAAATTGITLVSQGLAEEALSSVPGIKHVSGALGAGTVAVRLYRLATLTAQACSPV